MISLELQDFQLVGFLSEQLVVPKPNLKKHLTDLNPLLLVYQAIFASSNCLPRMGVEPIRPKVTAFLGQHVYQFHHLGVLNQIGSFGR